MSAAIAIPTTSSKRHSPLLGSNLAAATPWRSPADPFATASSEEYLSECPAIAILYEYAGAATRYQLGSLGLSSRHIRSDGSRQACGAISWWIAFGPQLPGAYGSTGGGASSSWIDLSQRLSMPSAVVNSVWSPRIASRINRSYASRTSPAKSVSPVENCMLSLSSFIPGP